MPLVLSMLSPRLPFLVLAAGGTNPVLFVTLIGLRLSITDWHWFDLGRRLGRDLAMKSRISRKILMWNPRAQKLGVMALLAVRPISRHLLLSGMVGMKSRDVAIIDVISTVVFLVAIIMTVKGLR
jgi:membrane protein DedA with SNARE-associated domain